MAGSMVIIVRILVTMHNKKLNRIFSISVCVNLLTIKIIALYTGSWKAKITNELTPKNSMTLFFFIRIDNCQYRNIPINAIGTYKYAFF